MIPIIQLQFGYLAYSCLTYRYLTYRYFIYRYFTYRSGRFAKASVATESRQLSQIRGPSPARSASAAPVTRPRWPDWWKAI